MSWRAALQREAIRLLPPFALDRVRLAVSEWNYEPGGWSPTPEQAGQEHEGQEHEGWNHSSIAEAQLRHWPILLQGLRGFGPLGVSHLPSKLTREDPADHNAIMSFGYVLALASRNKARLSVLDWGGSLGHYYLYAKALLPQLDLDYHCYEVPALCAAGRKVLPGVRFHEGADTLEGACFDLVLSSSSLHYFKDWRAAAALLTARTCGYLYIARLQTIRRAASFVVRQRPRGQGYRTSYVSWFLNGAAVVTHMESLGLELVREFLFDETWPVKRAPEPGRCRGYLFRRRIPQA